MGLFIQIHTGSVTVQNCMLYSLTVLCKDATCKSLTEGPHKHSYSYVDNVRKMMLLTGVILVGVPVCTCILKHICLVSFLQHKMSVGTYYYLYIQINPEEI